MPLKSRIWIVLSVVLFVATALLWHFARRQRENAGTPETTTAVQPIPLVITNGPLVVGAGVISSTPVLATNLFVEVVRNGPGAVVSNRLAYRLSNSAQPLAELLRNERAVLLRNALIDTARERPGIPEHLRAVGDPGAYIVQAHGALSDEFRALLAGAGAEVISFVPNNAYLVRGNKGVAGVIEASPLTQAVLPFEPYYKLDGALLGLAVRRELSPHALLNVVSFPGALICRL